MSNETAKPASTVVAGLGDDRLKKELGASPERQGREQVDRAITQSREVTEAERLELFRTRLFADVLPDLPEIPGYHICWLTTTNRADPIQRRIQLGYEPVRPEDAPGMEYATLKTGEWTGFIGINEMLAFKLPLSLYYKYMQFSHHEQPLAEESNLVSRADQLKEDAARDGGKIFEGDGMTELRSSHPAHGDFV